MITVIGGGTGTSVVLAGLKNLPANSLNAVVVVSDNGGSTRRLRDEFGFLPVGDLRQCIAALADGNNQEAIRQLLLYRFERGEGLRGHNLGNLILTALEDMSDSPGKAIATACKIFGTKGNVYPCTENNIQLVIEYQDGTIRIGEDILDDPQNGGKKIKNIKLSPHATIYPQAAIAITNSDQVIIGPGDLYGSLIPNTLPSGFKQALKKNKGQFIYISNLMTHFSQTHNLSVRAHLEIITRYCGRHPDFVVINTEKIKPEYLEHYALQQEFPVIDDLENSGEKITISKNSADEKFTIFRTSLVADEVPIASNADILQRSLVRHDSAKISSVIQSIVGL